MEKMRWLQDASKQKWLVGAGILLMALIGLSVFFPKTKEESVDVKKQEAEVKEETKAYEEALCARVEEIVNCISGVGQSHVSVTLDSGIEYVYAVEQRTDTDTTNQSNDVTSERASSEQKLILVDDQNGGKTALLRTTKLPKVRGVVVVCDGGADPMVVANVTEAVKTALGIYSSQVCVVKRTDSTVLKGVTEP